MGCKKLELERVPNLQETSISIENNVVYIRQDVIDIGNEKEATLTFYRNSDSTKIKESFSSTTITKTMVHSHSAYNLVPDVTYYAMTKLSNSTQSVESNKVAFKLNSTDINLTIDTVRITSSSEVSIEYTVSNFGSIEIHKTGLEVSKQSDFTQILQSFEYNQIYQDTTKYVDVANLSVSTTYYARSYVTFTNGVKYYSDTESFIIRDMEVITLSYALIIGNPQVLNVKGEILNLGQGITEHGFCYSTQTNVPTYNNNRVHLGSTTEIGEFSGEITDLQPGVKIYYRAFVTDGSVVRYGIIRNVIP